jgi:hypothetical protein
MLSDPLFSCHSLDSFDPFMERLGKSIALVKRVGAPGIVVGLDAGFMRLRVKRNDQRSRRDDHGS